MAKPTRPPPSFDEAFLQWFRHTTEQDWAGPQSPDFEALVRDGVGGRAFHQGTRWTGGLSDEQIATIEQTWRLRFPPDLHLFLRHLHATHPARWGAGFGDNDTLERYTCAGVYNWLTEADEIHACIDDVFTGLVFDVEHNRLWRDSWGPRPGSPRNRSNRLRALVDAAPRLIPIFGHRLLLAEPCLAGNPVLSVHQSDILVYGNDLRSYLLHEFTDSRADDDTDEYPSHFAAIPFWGELIG